MQLSPKSRLRARALALAAGAVLVTGPSRGQVVEVDMSTQVFHEPSASSHMTVYTPEVALSATPYEGVRVAASYQADVVTGASEAVKAGPLLSGVPDIVSRASVQDFRHVGSGSVALERDHARVSGAYTYGTENDYRSNAIAITAGTDFWQRNTDVELGYSHGFDQVCTLAQRNLPATLRQGLDSSELCFTPSPRVEALDISLDNFRLAWTQSWTPVLTTQLIFSAGLQHGFLGNPYRQVVIGPSGQSAQENHPDDRRRAAAALGLKYYARALKTALGGYARVYRDSWEVQSLTSELSLERYLSDWLSLYAHGRVYVQSGASFWSDDYTGGEPTYGPRGEYWSGDRELSPLTTLLTGARLDATWRAAGGGRYGGAFHELRASVGFDVLKTVLSDFTWAGQRPDDTLVLLPSLGASGTF